MTSKSMTSKSKPSKNDLLKESEKHHKVMTISAEKFNAVSDRIGKRLVQEFPTNRDLNIYNQIVSSVIEKKPFEPISIFATHIYMNDTYRDAILSSDEKFFRTNRHENLTSSDEDRIKAMFQFQSCWDKMNDDTKTFVKLAMKTIVGICGDYLIAKGNHTDVMDSLKKL